MKFRVSLPVSLPALALALFAGHAALAQAPSGSPAGSTGQCNDGTYSTAASKSGACAGHKGVKAWFTATPAKAAKTAPAAAAAPAATAAAKPAPAPAPAPTPAAAKPAPAAKPAATQTAAAAPGGGPGMVWVNTSTKVYHCPGDRFYGKTKDGKYMSEADAKAAGARGEKGKTCSK